MALTGLLGLGGGAGGTGFAGPQAANITPGTDAGQIQTAYTGNQNALAQQQALLQALQAQQGIQNQSQVYGQLQNVAAGQGPNPAQAMLNQSTGQNVANQAALMAGQRGAGANVGLMARQAAQQGAQTQQQAVGQAAALQSQQSLNAIGAAGNLATQQAQQQIGATQTATQAQQSEQQILQNALASQNNANVTMQSNINNANAGLANTMLQGQQGVMGGLMGGAGAALGLAEGGTVPEKMADGGFMSGWAGANADAPSGPISGFGQYMNGGANPGANALAKGMTQLGAGIGNKVRGSGQGNLQDTTPGAVANPTNNYATAANNFGTAPGASVGDFGASPMSAPNMGSQFNQDPSAPKLAKGGNVGGKLKSGGGVPGAAAVKGNSYKNDIVDAKLSPGEGVIDRETMNDPGPAGQMARLLMTMVEAKKKGKK
jgi:hypothetical protein